jgi:hypothetical protein
MPLHVLFTAFAAVFLVVAALLEFPRNPPADGYAHTLGWVGLACFVISTMVN